jgi:hypothetical protein
MLFIGRTKIISRVHGSNLKGTLPSERAAAAERRMMVLKGAAGFHEPMTGRGLTRSFGDVGSMTGLLESGHGDLMSTRLVPR